MMLNILKLNIKRKQINWKKQNRGERKCNQCTVGEINSIALHASRWSSNVMQAKYQLSLIKYNHSKNTERRGDKKMRESRLPFCLCPKVCLFIGLFKWENLNLHVLIIPPIFHPPIIISQPRNKPMQKNETKPKIKTKSYKFN